MTTLKMNVTKLGCEAGTHIAKEYKKDATYEIGCADLSKVFLDKGWASEVEGGAKLKESPENKALDPVEEDKSEPETPAEIDDDLFGEEETPEPEAEAEEEKPEPEPKSKGKKKSKKKGAK